MMFQISIFSSSMLGGVLPNFGPNTLIHEIGHYLAIKALFANANQKIDVGFFHGAFLAIPI